MQVKCVFSLDSNDFQDQPFAMANRIGNELTNFLYENIQLNEKVEFKKAVGTFHNRSGAAIGEIVLEDDDDIQ
jgi:hypothetical protein